MNIPVIDVFAGPGGLCEGFSSYKDNKVRFDVRLSIEKDAVAHQTLLLRAFFRKFDLGKVPEEYYQYVRGEISKNTLFKRFPREAKQASEEAWCAELGETQRHEVHNKIAGAIGQHEHWLLIGGPPCQAYSMVGRSRILGRLREAIPETIARELEANIRKRSGNLNPNEFAVAFAEAAKEHAKDVFHEDHRHDLYKEYLEIVAVHQPSIFVMENVKGILSSKVRTQYILESILTDLRSPWSALDSERRQALEKPFKAYEYELHSFVVSKTDGQEPSWNEFVISAEEYGVPQKRHRLILLGIRNDISEKPNVLKKNKRTVSVKDVIGNLPKLRSHISRRPDDQAEWSNAIKEGAERSVIPNIENCEVRSIVNGAIDNLAEECSVGGRFIRGNYFPAVTLGKWLEDKKLNGVIQHRARGHMVSDLLRYLFAASHAQFTGTSPTLYEFPKELLPNHKNTENLKNGAGRKQKGVIFEDRFRVQTADTPARTITSHISKDGHYYIHYDPAQCRSLTGREAARLQTFPDNYFFEGNRTEQYHQIGNAVPPFLAFQLAHIVADLLDRTTRFQRQKSGRS